MLLRRKKIEAKRSAEMAERAKKVSADSVVKIEVEKDVVKIEPMVEEKPKKTRAKKRV